ncbi:MAG: CAP domain-containing protein [Oligoflexales bacterium]|nr:CAP domain-containing protein [Oligoflexales bacterium]
MSKFISLKDLLHILLISIALAACGKGDESHNDKVVSPTNWQDAKPNTNDREATSETSQSTEDSRNTGRGSQSERENSQNSNKLEENAKESIKRVDISSSDLDSMSIDEHPICSKNEISYAQKQACQIELVLLTLTNKKRIAANLAPLSFNADLIQAARLWSCEMASSNYFGHEGWEERFTSSELTPGAENIVQVNRGNDFSTAVRMFDLLWESTLHRNNLMSPLFFQIGIGVCRGEHGLFATQLFTPDAAS